MTGQTSGGEPAVLEVAGVDVRFEGVVALDDVSLTVQANRIVGVIGPNGAGKTTLFNAVSRFVSPVRGSIRFRGQSLLGLPSWRLAHMGIARTLQGLGLWPALTVLENVVAGAPARARLGADMFAFPSADRRTADLRKEAMANLEELGVADRARSLPGALPHGVQKRVIIARALMARPSLLLLDEPASGLSASDVSQLVELLRSLRERMAIALVEHNVDMVLAVSDSITVLNLGRVLASGSPDEIRGNAEVATAYLGQEVAQMLEISNLTVAYGGVIALDQVSLSVAGGSITAVLGANGAGKTTLVRTISGLVKPRSGSVKLGDNELVGRSPEAIARLGIGHVPEGHGIISELTVDENLRLGGLWRRDRADQRVAIDEAYELFPPLLTRRGLQASNLSGGERQMLSIGRALVARPNALLLDEPSLGLATNLLALIMQRLKTLAAERRLAVLLIEQNARSALSVADQAVVLSLGKVALTDTADRLAGDDALRHAYLGF